MNVEGKWLCFVFMVFGHLLGSFRKMLACGSKCVLSVIKHVFEGGIFCVNVGDGKVER